MSDALNLLQATAIGIYSINRNGIITFANAEATRLLGRGEAELLGQDHHEVLSHTCSSGSAYSKSTCPICNAARAGDALDRCAGKATRSDGSMIPVEYAVRPYRGATGDGSVITFRDMTEQQNLHLQLLRAQKLESIGQLAAGIAHEINTPIQYVCDNTRFFQGAFQQLATLLDATSDVITAARDDQFTPDLVDRLRSVAEQAEWDYFRAEIPAAITQSLDGINKVAVIVRAMKEFSHSSPTSKSSVNLHQTIESTVTIARNEWKYVADVKMDFDPTLPALTCIPGEIGQVILNLLVNAAHAIGDARDSSSPKGTITISTRHTDDHAEIRIKDTGTGIPHEVRSKIFDPFFTTKPVGKGTGQGLALAYRIIAERHKGSIDFESEVGKGTTFIIRLPLEDPNNESSEEHREEAHSVCG